MLEMTFTAPDNTALRAALRSKLREMDERDASWGHRLRSWPFWIGAFYGAMLMCLFDLTDLHICVGECDGAGYDLLSNERR